MFEKLKELIISPFTDLTIRDLDEIKKNTGRDIIIDGDLTDPRDYERRERVILEKPRKKITEEYIPNLKSHEKNNCRIY